MTIDELIDESCVLIDVNVTSKKQLIQDMAQALSNSGLIKTADISVRDIISSAMERERLGTTGVGSGVALPHARLAGLDKIYGVIARLNPPLDFESVDERPIDLAVFLATPEEAGGLHLRALALVSRLLRRDDVRARLRAAPSAESLYTALIDAKRVSAA